MFYKNQYYYDEQNFQFVQKKTWLREFVVKFGVAMAAALVLVVYTYPYWNKLELNHHKNEQRALSAGLSDVNRKLARFEKKLDKIHHNDQSFYRSILNEKAIDAAVWEGGTGGTRAANSGLPATLRETIARISKINYKLEIQNQSFDKIHQIALVKADELKHVPCIRPIEGKVCSGFGYRNDPFFGYGHFHSGVDIIAKIGTPVKTVADGTIITSGVSAGGYGVEIEVDHGQGYITKYAHLSSLKSQIGQKVKRGDIIGYTGNTGYSTGPHLHYEVIKRGEKVNPMDYFYID